ncbi:MAG: C25 family cysteine peptidase [Candidatus Aegiribacteria sp.]
MFRLSLAALLLTILSPVSGDEITFQFSLDEDQVQLSSWLGDDVVSIPGGVVPFDHGEPALQGLPYTFILPQGTSIGEVSVDVHSLTTLPGRFSLAPVTGNILSRPLDPADPAPVYFSSQTFPGQPAANIRSGSRSGFRLGSFVMVPFVYTPLSGELSVITSATVTIDCRPDQGAEAVSLTGRQFSSAAQAVERLVHNPEMLPACAPEVRSGTDGDPVWVAIGAAEMETVLQPLVDHRNLYTGEAEYVTVEWITANYSGYDTPEKIRNYLKEQYYDHSLIYALIVGDYGETTRISELSINSGQTVLNNVADHYFIDLDGSWDANGNHKYGETTDSLDYYSDLYVGRFCSDSEVFLQTMVDKTISYETEPVPGDWQTTAVLIGAGLWPPDYWGSFVCEDIDDLIPADWTVEKLYETASGHPNDQIDIINQGCSYVSPHGHGSSGGIYWYDYSPTEIIANNNYANMNNIDMLPVYHSIACMAGELTVSASIAERLMLSPYGGGIAVMFNSSYGWGTPPARGPSEWLEVKFAEELFLYGTGEVGVAQCNAKDAIQPLTSVPLINWVTQENNLLGDPALAFVGMQTGMDEGPGYSFARPALGAPSPNPSTAGCSIAYDIPASGDFSVTVYDLSGRAVRRLHSGQLAEGSGSVMFDGRDGSGNVLPSGCYSVVLSGPSGMDAVNLVIAR